MKIFITNRIAKFLNTIIPIKTGPTTTEKGPSEMLIIQSRNFPDYKLGIQSRPDSPDSPELYIVKKHIVKFTAITPGLTGEADTVSFQSTDDDKYMRNEDTYLDLHDYENGSGFALATTFKIYPDKFFGVSTCR